jgi:2-dehydropantoate 2-reductase
MASLASQSSQAQRSTVAVVGLGRVGGIAAAWLQHAGRHNVTVCARRPIARLTLEHNDGAVELPLHTLTNPDDARPVDWVLLCTKAHETASAGPWLQKLCTPATRVAVLQNGIGHVERVAPFANGAAAFPVIVYYNGERLADDRVRFRHVSEHDVAVADDALGHSFVDMLAGTPITVLKSRDFKTLIWRKLLINAVVNPITALTRQRQAVMRRSDVHELALGVLAEAVGVARADGAQLAADEAEQTLKTLYTYPPEAGTSMYFDTMAGRPLEIEALTGAIVAAGDTYGIAVPLNRALLTLARAVSDANAKG